ncbi:MAG: nitroreductase [Erysipelotrichaceae bacterium]|nr:nitroreductase [Erysipelotrichaceae bacterium]
MNETIQCLQTRRSCRKYKNTQITDEQLHAILETGTYAPTGQGTQNPLIVAVQNPKLVSEISRLNASVMNAANDPFYGAPTVLIVFANTERRTYVDDGNMVIGNLLNAAHAVGVDSCYIYRARETFKTEEGKQFMKQWGIPETYEGIGNVILGYGEPEGFRPTAARKENYYTIIK